jgi:hypothetical protein
MPCRASILGLAVLASGMSLAPAGWAQKRAGGARQPHASSADNQESAAASKTPIDEFETMSPEHQQQALQRLPSAEREKLQRRIEKFNQLPPEQQRTLKNLYNRLHQLSSDRQNAVRKAINKFTLQRPDRQKAIREELRGLAAAPEQERLGRMASPEFRGKFNSQERDIVRDMSPLLPPR